MTKPTLKEIFEYNTIKMSDQLHTIANDALRYGCNANSLVNSIRDVADHSSQQYATHIDKFEEKQKQKQMLKLAQIESNEKLEIDTFEGQNAIRISPNYHDWYKKEGKDMPVFMSVKNAHTKECGYTALTLDETIKMRDFLTRAIVALEKSTIG